MILHRVVFQAKFGKADDLVAHFKTAIQELPDELNESLQPRILTDLSGSFDTVVVETTHESLAAFEEFRKAMFAREEALDETIRQADLIASGQNEYYTIEL